MTMNASYKSVLTGVLLYASVLGMGSRPVLADEPAVRTPKFERRGAPEKISVTSPDGPTTLLCTFIESGTAVSIGDRRQLEEVTDERGEKSLVGPRGPMYAIFNQEIWGVSKDGISLRITRSQPVAPVVRGRDEVVERFVERSQREGSPIFWNGPGGYRKIDLVRLFGIRDFVASRMASRFDGELQSVNASGKGVEIRLTMSSNVVLALTLNERLEPLDAHRNGVSLPLLLRPLDDGDREPSAHRFHSRFTATVPSDRGTVELACVQHAPSGGELSANELRAVVIPEGNGLAVVPLESRMAVFGGKLVAFSMLEKGRLALFGRPRATLPSDASSPEAFDREMTTFDAEWKRDGRQLKPEAILDLSALLAADARFPPGTTFDLGAGPIQIRKGVLSKTVNSSAGPNFTVFMGPDRKLSLTPPGS